MIESSLIPTNLLQEETDVLLINTKWAKILGLNESIFIHQVHYWLKKNLKKGRNIHDGRVWCYNTYQDWVDNNFPFWTARQVRYAVTSLINQGVIITGNYNKLKIDKTIWYTIDYVKLEEMLLATTDKIVSRYDTVVTPYQRLTPETTYENTDFKTGSKKRVGEETSMKWIPKSKSYQYPDIGKREFVLEFENGAKLVRTEELVSNPKFDSKNYEISQEEKLAQLKMMGFDINTETGELFINSSHYPENSNNKLEGEE